MALGIQVISSGATVAETESLVLELDLEKEEGERLPELEVQVEKDQINLVAAGFVHGCSDCHRVLAQADADAVLPTGPYRENDAPPPEV